MSIPNLDEERRRRDALIPRLVAGTQGSHDAVAGQTGGGSPPIIDMERLIKLETAVENLRTAMAGLHHSQNLTIGAVAGFGGIIVALMIYTFTRVDQLSHDINAVPEKVAIENREIVRTLSSAITATRQQAPQVILMPAVPPPATGAQAPSQPRNPLDP